VTDWRKYIFYFDTAKVFKKAAYNHIIIDLETNGLDPSNSIIVSAGFFDCHKVAEVYILDDPSKAHKFQKFARSLAISYLNQGYNLYAYSAQFERKFLRINKIHDLQFYTDDECWDPWLYDYVPCTKWASMRSVAWSLAKHFFDVRVDEILDLSDPVNHQIPAIYQQYLKTRDEQYLDLIVKHNYNDLILEFVILAYLFLLKEKVRQFIKDHYFYYPSMDTLLSI